MQSSRIELRRTTFTVTLRCTLRCKLCSVDICNYDVLPHYDSDFIAKELKSYFEVVDYVKWLQYSGGEPLLNEDLPEMIEEAMKYKDRFEKLMLFANGTVIPSVKLLNALCKYRDKIHFFFSNYGEISFRSTELIECLSKNEIDFTERKYYGDQQYYDGWVDFRDWDYCGLDENELADMYKECGTRVMNFTLVQNGQLHLCRKSYRGMELGVVPRARSDYLDILDTKMTVEEKRNHLINMLQRPYLEACNYCKAMCGTSDKSKRFPAAEQM